MTRPITPNDAPLPSKVYGWAYWAHAQAGRERLSRPGRTPCPTET